MEQEKQKTKKAPSLLHSNWPPFQCSKISKYEVHSFSTIQSFIDEANSVKRGWILASFSFGQYPAMLTSRLVN